MRSAISCAVSKVPLCFLAADFPAGGLDCAATLMDTKGNETFIDIPRDGKCAHLIQSVLDGNEEDVILLTVDGGRRVLPANEDD